MSGRKEKRQTKTDAGDDLIYRGKVVRRMLAERETIIANQRTVIADQSQRINTLIIVLRNHVGVAAGLAEDGRAFLTQRYPEPVGTLPIEQPDTIDAVADRMRRKLNSAPEEERPTDAKVATAAFVDGVRLVGADPAAEDANLQAAHLVKMHAAVLGHEERAMLEAFCIGDLLKFAGEPIARRCAVPLHGLISMEGNCGECLLPASGGPGWLAIGPSIFKEEEQHDALKRTDAAGMAAALKEEPTRDDAAAAAQLSVDAEDRMAGEIPSRDADLTAAMVHEAVLGRPAADTIDPADTRIRTDVGRAVAEELDRSIVGAIPDRVEFAPDILINEAAQQTRPPLLNTLGEGGAPVPIVASDVAEVEATKLRLEMLLLEARLLELRAKGRES